jgi:hypothetical protein
MRTITKTLAAAAAVYALAPAAGALGRVSAKPDANGLPGSGQLEQLVNGLFFWALLAGLGHVGAELVDDQPHAARGDPRDPLAGLCVRRAVVVSA